MKLGDTTFSANLSHGKKCDANWRGDGERFASRCQLSAGLIDAEFNDLIGVLIFGEEEFAGGIDREVTRLLAAGGNDFHLGQCSTREGEVSVLRPLVSLSGNPIDDDRIIATIGGVKELAAGME